MTTWNEFEKVAPSIAAVFERRHAATGNLCMLGTLRPDGFPRVSPMEPRFFEGQLWIGGMPSTAKFEDLARDSRFTLHTATIDSHVADGDAKVWGTAEDVLDDALHQRYAEALYEETGFDLRGRTFEHFSRQTWLAQRQSRSTTATWTSRRGETGPASGFDASTEDQCCVIARRVSTGDPPEEQATP
jgi:general stress protein 26